MSSGVFSIAWKRAKITILPGCGPCKSELWARVISERAKASGFWCLCWGAAGCGHPMWTVWWIKLLYVPEAWLVILRCHRSSRGKGLTKNSFWKGAPLFLNCMASIRGWKTRRLKMFLWTGYKAWRKEIPLTKSLLLAQVNLQIPVLITSFSVLWRGLHGWLNRRKKGKITVNIHVVLCFELCAFWEKLIRASSFLSRSN